MSLRTRIPSASRAHLNLEHLETRLVPYSLSGNAWPRPDLVTISFVPDGAVVASNGGNIPSNLFAEMNAVFGGPEAGQTYAPWQRDILRAAQTWAQQTNLNFKVVTDNGAQIGTGTLQQGASGFGDIRIGGYDFGNTSLAQAYLPAPINNTSFAGDIQFNTGQDFSPGTGYNLYTVALHEIGHALGLYHGPTGSVLYGSYEGAYTTLTQDDANGVRAVTGWTSGGVTSPGHQGARASDGYDVAASNGGFGTASDVTTTINTTAKTLTVNGDVTTTYTPSTNTTVADVDFYKFTVPTNHGGTLNVKLQSSGLSLLAPTLTIYNSAQSSLATISGAGQYGATLTRSVSVTAGATYYIRVAGATADALGSGKYTLAVGFANTAAPAVGTPSYPIANGTPVSSGGGQATKVTLETRVNTTTAGWQGTDGNSLQSVAADANGNYVVVWTGVDPSGYGVYAQRFTAAGAKVGGEFRVNTTVADTQRYPAVAVNATGSFVVVWSSMWQDGTPDYGVYAQRYDAQGKAVGGEIRVNTTTADHQSQAKVAVAANGDFVVVWASNNQDGSAYGVYGQKFTAAGVKTGPTEFRVNTVTTGAQWTPSIDMDQNGNFVVAFGGSSNFNYDIFVRRYNAAASPLTTAEVQVNTYTNWDQMYPNVASDQNGNYTVTWVSANQDGAGFGVYARRYNSAGTALGSEFRVNTTTAGDQNNPSIGMDTTGNFIVSWTNTDPYGAPLGVYGQQYNASGNPVGGEFRIDTNGGNVGFASVAVTSSNAVAVWGASHAQDADGGVFAQTFKLGAATGLHRYSPGGHHDDHDHDHEEAPGRRRGAYAILPADLSVTDLSSLARTLGIPVVSRTLSARRLGHSGDLREASLLPLS